MRNHKSNRERPANWKRKFASSLCMLLIASILMVATSYAWLVMSVAPEVTGIATNVGANGALEIALLTTETREDPSQIKSMGGSLATRNPSANNTWGNLLDLSYEQYGLQEMVLWPSRLDLSQTADGYTVNSNILRVPTYGYDGRIVDLTNNTVSGTYDGENFSTIIGTSDYGVRVIGTNDTISAQNAALALAKSNIRTYMNTANSTAKNTMTNNGEALVEMMVDRNNGYDDADLAVLKAMIADLDTAMNYIDMALRQGMIAYAASQIGNEDDFTSISNEIQNADSLTEVLDILPDEYELPEGYAEWITKCINSQGSLDAASNTCEDLNGGSYSWEDVKNVLSFIMNIDSVYINGDSFAEFDTSNVNDLLANGMVISLTSGSGVFADVADFTGDYTAYTRYLVVDIEIEVITTESVPHLQALSVIVNEMEAADGTAASDTKIDLTTTFGYVLDMAFRTNAPLSNLLLQTMATQRVYDDSDNERTMGGGSYMEFTTPDENMTVEQMLELMDAIRVAFVDVEGNVMGIAKLNTSNRTVSDGKVKAPLYLYSFHIDEEDGSLQMDQRQSANNVLTALEQNTAKILSVVVWLDGDLVDNSKVSATEETSLNGVLNLQFASSANLVPADNSALMNITADKDDLLTALTAEQETYNAGQGTYTTISWEAYTAAYDYANAVAENAGASEQQIYNAAYALAEAKLALTPVSHDAMTEKIEEIRDLMGETTDVARYVMKAADGSYYTMGEYTQDQLDGATKVGDVYQVDYNKNLKDEGNDIKTPIYTDESWSALAAALYEAEAVNMNADATDAAMDAALTALETAYEALERKVFYLPYEYEGNLYYFAISDVEDTYGKWYYADFTRVNADLLILKLDAKAALTTIGQIVQPGYINSFDKGITPYFQLMTDLYPELATEEIIGIKWTAVDSDFFTEVMGSAHYSVLEKLIAKAGELNTELDDANKIDVTEAETIRDQYNDATAEYVTLADAVRVISALQNDIAEAKALLAVEDPAYMTSEQRTLLTEAISRAKTAENYDTDAELADLRAAVDAAQALLDSTDPVAGDTAATTLATLNAQLTANDMDAVSVENTIVHKIPVTTEQFEIVNALEIPGVQLALTGKTGTTSLEAIVVTKGGVVFKVTKEVTVYSKALDLDMYELEDDGDHYDIPTYVTLTVGETMDLRTKFDYYDIAFDAEQKALGNVIVDEDDYVWIAVPETIKARTWSTDDSAIVSISGSNAEVCTITAVKAGTTEIRVSVTTNEGNTYTAVVTVTVTG